MSARSRLGAGAALLLSCLAAASLAAERTAPPRFAMPGPPKDAPAPKAIAPGPYGVTIQSDPSLPNHTLYRPADLEPFAGGRLPIVAWANGACVNVGRAHQKFLVQIASQGYFVVAVGPKDAPPPDFRPNPDGSLKPIDQAHPERLVEAIDWAIAQNRRSGSVYAGKLATQQVAVMGHSCGGAQTLQVSADPRVKTSVIWNSGVLGTPPGTPQMFETTKESLRKLHAPVAYFIGGPTDIAFAVAADDFTRITVPIFMANVNSGHNGTFEHPNGGWYAEIGAAWLAWQLKGDMQAARMFVGADCGLCVDPAWKVEKKGIP